MDLSVLRPDEIGHRLRLALVVMRAVARVVNVVRAVAVAVLVVGLRRANVLQLVDRAALGAALNRAVAGGGEPDDVVGVGRAAGATDVLLVTEALDDDRVVESA